MNTCPECEATLTIPADAMEGEIVPCPDCGAELEVISVAPRHAGPGPRSPGRLGGVDMRLAVLCSRIRVEEKLLLAELERRGVAYDRVDDSELVLRQIGRAHV